jgi:uncharacterized SAM-binding protein YcdF (DUF218 family)
MRTRGFRKGIVVTSLWHTARAGRTFRHVAPDLQFLPVGSEDPAWGDGDWWTRRQGRKTFFTESIKTIADFLGI